MDLVKIATVAAQECEKQQVEILELGRLLDAYNYAIHIGINDRYDFLTLARKIDPRNEGYRKVPVTFKSGGTSANSQRIDWHMATIFDLLKNRHDKDAEYLYGIVKEFLWIHPFIDGNGRLAWILWNWLNGTMDNPTNLPEFF